MKENKKVLATYSLSKANKKFLEEKAEQEGRSVSSFLDRLLTSMIQERKA